MNIGQLKPASEYVKKYGVKALVYGGPGSGKTPMLETAPNAVLCAIEPGLLSMRNSKIPTWEAYTYDKIEEFFKWATESAEAAKFDTLCFDSISQAAEIVLARELSKNKDGRKAYGEMSNKIMGWLTSLYFMKNKHVWLICKQTVREEPTGLRKVPYFPGQDLNVKVPHMFDEILHVGINIVPAANHQLIKSFRTAESADVLARDRSGKLDEFEPTDIGHIFRKIMA